MRLYKKIINRLSDSDRSYEERTIIMLAILSVVALTIALIFDIIGRESIVENITLALIIVFVPVVVTLSVHFKKVRAGATLLVCVLVFVILPITFFYGGGMKGGGIYWIIFGYMYIGISLSGVMRIVMMSCLSAVGLLEFWAAYRHPEWVFAHTVKMSFLDAMVSVLLVGICIYVMFMYQKKIFADESNRARAESEKAEELNRSQNRFFSSMSHEIRTPINSILGLNEVILRQDDATDEIIKDAVNIRGAGRMLLALINDILDFSKIEAGRMDIVAVDYRVADMMSEIVNMIWLRANEKGLAFVVEIDPNVPSVLFGDEVRIKQIIINLLNNAVKYTQEGSVGLHIEAEKAGENQVRLLISVSDTGIGIKQEAIPNLFDAFKRVDQEKNRYIEGTGLGLSIVKQLVDLMDGSISVNSVYGQGSTFTVSLIQEISDSKVLGNINISSHEVSRHKYEHIFTAPDARILIVDDNEMNLEVEKKLIADTLVVVDTASNGRDALAMTLERRYDVILMDHLMPVMDGIECLKSIRSQIGGLNADTPVIVLTANAGSENRELYNMSGFDGYLVKPVSGKELEEILVRFIPQEKLAINRSVQMNSGEMDTASGYSRKLPVIFASGSLSDLPEILIKRLGISILYHTIVTNEGIFRDNVEMSADETVRYMESGRAVTGVTPEVSNYVEFFGQQLRKAHHVIYVALTTSMSDDYERAQKAAGSFENVTVINSECMSSSLGLLLLVGYKLAQQNMPVDKIVAEMEEAKHRMHSGFIMGTTEYMARKRLVGPRVHRVASSLDLRPSIRYRNDKYSIGGVWMGSIRHCYEGYIRKALPRTADPDPEILFVTYVSIPEEELVWIEKQIRKRAHFEHIIFQQASAIITTNCGPGTFGLLYMEKGSRSYNLSSLLPREMYHGEDDPEGSDVLDHDYTKTQDNDNADISGVSYQETDDCTEETIPSESVEWFNNIESIDGTAGVKNSGSVDAFRTVLKFFYDAIPTKAAELEEYYNAEDWDNYTIKVHALKSSAKLIGAMVLSDEAQDLENAGKEGDISFIRDNHAAMIERFRGYTHILKDVFEEKPDAGSEESGLENEPETGKAAAPKTKPEADADLMSMVYEEIGASALQKDMDRLNGVIAELNDYSIPSEDKDLWSAITDAADTGDYETITELLSQAGKQ